MFDPERPKPALFAPGDAVKFQSIDAGAYASIRRAVESRSYDVESAPAAE
jgi:allophanate hydrolase subunit 1